MAPLHWTSAATHCVGEIWWSLFNSGMQRQQINIKTNNNCNFQSKQVIIEEMREDRSCRYLEIECVGNLRQGVGGGGFGKAAEERNGGIECGDIVSVGVNYLDTVNCLSQLCKPLHFLSLSLSTKSNLSRLVSSRLYESIALLCFSFPCFLQLVLFKDF